MDAPRKILLLLQAGREIREEKGIRIKMKPILLHAMQYQKHTEVNLLSFWIYVSPV